MKDQNAETPVFVRFKVMRGTCYGSPALTVEMKFSDNEKIICEVSEGLMNKTVLLERAETEKFLSKILEIIEKSEILSGLRHVDVRYHAEIEWENLNFINGENSGEFKAFSNEWFTEAIELFMEQEAETAEIAERFQKILETKPHRHALEIYSAVKDFRRKFLM